MNLLLPALVAIASAFTPAVTSGQDGSNRQIGTSDDASEASNGRLRAKMLVIPDIDAFWRAWEGPTPPQINTTATITQAAPVHAIIIFGGCTAGADGLCKLSVTFAMIAPDGSPYGEAATAPAWAGPPGGDKLLASAASFGFRLEPKDKLGQYRMSAILTDEIARTSVTVREVVVAKTH